MIEVWTDGACSARLSGKPGGWAWSTRDKVWACGGQWHTTNQRMEMLAAIKALEMLPAGPVTIVSDSAYVVNCFNERWWLGWNMDAAIWTKERSGDPVANADLWERLFRLVDARPSVVWQHVRGHSGDEMNEFVDVLAVRAKVELELGRQ